MTMQRVPGNDAQNEFQFVMDQVCSGLGPVLITPGNKHFSWRKAANVFGIGEDAFWNSPLDAEGRVDLAALANLIEKAREARRPIVCLTSVAGTTEAGEIDPIDRVGDLLDKLAAEGVYVWHHVDAAYGGFYCSMLGGEAEQVLAEGRRSALAAIGRADSVTIDPHKLGYVPYACGAFLTRDPEAYRASSFQAPYIDRAEREDKEASAKQAAARLIAFAKELDVPEKQGGRNNEDTQKRIVDLMERQFG